LRSTLNGIHTWAHLLEDRLRGLDDPLAQRALDGINAGVRDQVRNIENLLGPPAVEPPLRRVEMSKRKDIQPEMPGDPPRRVKPEKPATENAEAPGGRESAAKEQDARNKSTRKGER